MPSLLAWLRPRLRRLSPPARKLAWPAVAVSGASSAASPVGPILSHKSRAVSRAKFGRTSARCSTCSSPQFTLEKHLALEGDDRIEDYLWLHRTQPRDRYPSRRSSRRSCAGWWKAVGRRPRPSGGFGELRSNIFEPKSRCSVKRPISMRSRSFLINELSDAWQHQPESS